MFYSLPEYTKRLQLDLRQERVHNQLLKRSHIKQKGKIRELKKKVSDWKKRYQEQERENEILKKELEKLSKTNNRYQVGLFDHGNFKSPDNREKKSNGGQIGHTDTNQDKQRHLETYKKQRIFAKSCGRCGHTLTRVNATVEKTLIDIQINRTPIEVILESERQWCGNCHKEVRAKSPQSLPFTEYGINTFMMILMMRFKTHQSIEAIGSSMYNEFGLKLSSSSIVSLLRQSKEYLKDRYEELKQSIREGAVMYNDETGWLVHGQKAWMWIMANDKQTVYVASESRGKGIFEEMYGNSQAVSMHDGYSSYESVTGIEKTAYCWSHVLRFAYEESVTEKTSTTIACQIRDRLVTLYQTVRSNTNWTYEKREEFLREELEKILSIKAEDEASKNILHRITVQKEGLIKALLLTPDGTNNLSERELRPIAIGRNISFGSSTFKGMETTAILRSIVQTIGRDKEKQLLPTLQNYIYAGIQDKYPQYIHPPSFAP